jgi:catalase
VDNIVDAMKPALREIQLRQISHFYKADPDYGTRVAQALGIDISQKA